MGSHPTFISKNTRIVGDVHFTGELHVEGTVVGTIIAKDNAELEICRNGRVEGVIQVPTVVVRGLVQGDIRSSKHVELSATGVVNGNVFYNLVEMVQGSQVNGGLIHADEAKRHKEEQAQEE